MKYIVDVEEVVVMRSSWAVTADSEDEALDNWSEGARLEREEIDAIDFDIIEWEEVEDDA